MIEKPIFYRRLNDAFISRDADQVVDLLSRALSVFAWSGDDHGKLCRKMAERLAIAGENERASEDGSVLCGSLPVVGKLQPQAEAAAETPHAGARGCG
jgi:hypothetical protein